MRRLFLSVIVLLPIIAFTEASYELMIDRYMSPYAGGEDLLTLYRALEKKEDQLFPPKETPSRKLLPIIGRWAELALFWDPLAMATVTFQHEMFGHGYRIRTLKDARVDKVKISWPYPYGSSGGVTIFRHTENIKVSDLIAITLAGSEAEYILGNQLNSKWVSEGKIDARSAQLYNNAKLGTLLYAFSTDESDVGTGKYTGNDIADYIDLINLTYPHSHMSLRSVQNAMIWNLADVTLYNAFFSSIYYILTGKQCSHWMIPLGKNLSYLPSISTHLAPYGIEYSFDQFLKYKNRPIFAYLKMGSYAGVSYGGVGFQYDEMLKFDSLSFGLRMHSFLQPRYVTNFKYIDIEEGVPPSAKAQAALESVKFGGALSLITKYCINDTYTSLYADIGAKTSGYIPGYQQKGGLVARIGISGQF